MDFYFILGRVYGTFIFLLKKQGLSGGVKRGGDFFFKAINEELVVVSVSYYCYSAPLTPTTPQLLQYLYYRHSNLHFRQQPEVAPNLKSVWRFVVVRSFIASLVFFNYYKRM